jgi:acyl carrier protein
MIKKLCITVLISALMFNLTALAKENEKMTRQEIEEKVKAFLIDDLEIDEEKIFDDAKLKEDMGIDSLDFVDIVVIVEKNFGFKIKPEEMQGVTTLSQFCDYIESKVNVSA